MTTPDAESVSSSMFLAKGDAERSRSASARAQEQRSSVTTTDGEKVESITVQDFFDFMKTAYQVYEEEDEDDELKIDWEELSKLTVLNHVIDSEEKNLLFQSATATIAHKPVTSKSMPTLCADKVVYPLGSRFSCNAIEDKPLQPHAKVEMLGVWTETNLNCKLNEVINEGILDSILPYLIGYKKPTKTTSAYVPAIKKVSESDLKKPSSFGGFLHEKDSRDRLGRRKSSIAAIQDRINQKQDGDVEIHVCDEVKGLKKDFRCPQKLLVSKMGYFADVTAGQRLEDMDISVHCDIQIFDWLMRWVKRDSILVADWLLLEPGNVVPILVSASFLQMEPLIQDCLTYCHSHMNEIVKSNSNLSCLSDALLTRLAAMYTNAELEAIRDRKDKIQSRLYCKMILSLAEPVPETLRGHYSTLATLFKCQKCNKLLGVNIAEQVPCQPACMRVDRRGNVLSTHTKELSWSLNEYISWLYGELRSWRRVYWRLWADCHFLYCHLCDSYFPAYQMEWCCQHSEGAQMFALSGRPPLPAGRHPCCGERAYRFETLPRKTGCTFCEHRPMERSSADSAVLELYAQFRDIVAMRPPQLMFPERITRLVNREPGEEQTGRLLCKEVFWWEGVQLVPPRAPLGLLGRLYTSDSHFNPYMEPGSSVPGNTSAQSLATSHSGSLPSSPLHSRVCLPKATPKEDKKGASSALNEAGDGGAESASGSSSEESSASDDGSEASEEEACTRRKRAARKPVPKPPPPGKKRGRQVGRQWIVTHSARSNQDGQRRYEERAVRQMRAAIARRAALFVAQKPKAPPGGVYAKLEADWRERNGQRPARAVQSARGRQGQKK